MKSLLGKLTLILMMATLSGCSSLMNKVMGLNGVGGVIQQTSPVDNSTIMTVKPAFLCETESCIQSYSATRIGAIWKSNAPNQAVLTLLYDVSDYYDIKYTTFKSINITVDGKDYSFNVTAETKHDNFRSESHDFNVGITKRYIRSISASQVVIPYALLEQMVNAKDCRIQIETTAYKADTFFSNSALIEVGLAKPSIKQLVDEVNKFNNKN